jgi:SAM-dependent methyltransferase
MDERIKAIKKFWDSRAREYGADRQATLREKYLRLLEIKTMKRLIRRYTPKRVLDVGCGNGYSTKLYAREFPGIQFIGMDYSEEMIQYAQQSPVPNCRFFVGDVLDTTSLKEGDFDLIMSQRCLQNLPDYELQQKAINNLLTRKNRDGHMLLMECSKDGVAQLNNLRVRLGKKPIDNIEPWHNNFFEDKSLRADFGARIVYFSSTYMFFAKVLHNRLSALGYLLPPLGKFGYDRLYIIT